MKYRKNFGIHRYRVPKNTAYLALVKIHQNHQTNGRYPNHAMQQTEKNKE